MTASMPPKDPGAFDFYPERFWFSVEGWSEQEICRYFRLLCQQWMRDGLPDDRKLMQGLARGKIADRVFEKFPIADDGKRRNKKLETERKKQRRRILESSFRQSVLAWKRWHKDEPLPDHLLSIEAFQAYLNGDATAMPQDVPLDVPPDMPPHIPPLSPRPTTHDPPLLEIERAREAARARAKELDSWIEKIREAYPRKGSQQDCRYAIRTALDAGLQTPQQILDDVLACAVWVKAAEEKGTCSFVPTAKAFFCERQWTEPQKFEGIAINVKAAQNANKPATHKRRDSGDLNSDDRYA